MRYIFAMTGTCATIVCFNVQIPLDGMTLAIIGTCVLCTVIIGALIYSLKG